MESGLGGRALEVLVDLVDGVERGLWLGDVELSEGALGGCFCSILLVFDGGLCDF